VSALEYAIREDRQEVVLVILDRAGDVVVNAVGPRGTTALLVACEHRREAIARALLDLGAKVDALKNRLDVESATMLAKIGTEKGIMLFGIKRDQKEADFRNQNLGPADTILIASDLVNSSLSKCDLRGNNLGVEGWTSIFNALCDSPTSKITAWDLSGEKLGPGIARPLAEYLSASTMITECNLRGNNLDSESAKMLTEVAKHKGISLYGILRDQPTANFSKQNLIPPDAILLGSDLSQAVVTGGLTSINLSGNHLTNYGTDMTGIKELAAALGLNGALTSIDFSGNQLLGIWTDYYGNQKGTYTAEGITAIADALRVNGALTEVR
jgi:uncharacterized protein YjbI with pentapeptide repeats